MHQCNFLGLSHTCGKQLLGTSCSTQSSACNNWALTGRIFVKFYIWVFK